MRADGDSWSLRFPGFDGFISNDPMWLQKGGRLLFLSNKNGAGGHLWTVDPAGSSEALHIPQVAGSLGDGVRLPALSKAGHHLAFTKLSEDENIWRVDLTGNSAGRLKKLIGSTRQEKYPQYSPDVRFIAFESDRSGFPEIWVAQADGTHEFALTNFRGPVTGSPSWSPDGKQIAFDTRASVQPQVFVMNVEAGSKPRQITHGPGDNVLPCWSADGQFIYFNSARTGDSRIWKISAAGGTAEQVTTHFSFDPQVSPDGKTLYFMTGRGENSEIHRLDLSSRDEERVVSSARDRSFSPTNRGVYYLQRITATSQFLRFWNSQTKQDTVITRIEGRSYSGLSASQDNRLVLLVKDDAGGMDLMLVDDFK
ncbi:MAG: hypothetical protein M3Y72_05565 [Acidobacteriota bacterium]|nr:hypothetical protein [Acidobacteriota bacterium]